VTNDHGRNVSNRRVIHASCTQHGGSRGFTNLMVTKCDGDIDLDPAPMTPCVYPCSTGNSSPSSTGKWRAPAAHSVAEGHPMNWGLSILDFQAHAIDPLADHPVGVYRARCGHLLMAVTELCEQPPGRVCPECERATR
jgi:hypothetical protein